MSTKLIRDRMDLFVTMGPLASMSVVSPNLSVAFNGIPAVRSSTGVLYGYVFAMSSDTFSKELDAELNGHEYIIMWFKNVRGVQKLTFSTGYAGSMFCHGPLVIQTVCMDHVDIPLPPEVPDVPMTYVVILAKTPLNNRMCHLLQTGTDDRTSILPNSPVPTLDPVSGGLYRQHVVGHTRPEYSLDHILLTERKVPSGGVNTQTPTDTSIVGEKRAAALAEYMRTSAHETREAALKTIIEMMMSTD